MAIVYCAAVDCKHHNGKNRCVLKKICLSEGHLHTKYQGVKQVWECKNYEQSEAAQKIGEILAAAIGKVGGF